jgi:transposase
MPLPHKPSAAETEERRRKVFHLLMEGLSHAEIARQLAVNRKTIVNDAKRISSSLRERASDADSFSEIGTAAAKLEKIESEAMASAHQTANLRDRNYLLQTASTACERRIRLLMDAGLVDRAPLNVGLTVQDFKKMSTEELKQVGAQIIERLKQYGIGSGPLLPGQSNVSALPNPKPG